MKKIALFFTLTILSTSIFSQKLGIGLRYGIGLNTITTDPATPNTSTLMSPFNAAAVAEVGLLGLLNFQPELGICTMGASQGGTDIKITYMTVNVLPKIGFGFSKIGIFGLLGPSFNSKMSATTTTAGISSDIPNVASSNFSLIAGVGGSYKMGRGKIFVDARYNIGLMNASDGGGNFKLNQTAINIGYMFKIL